MYQEKTAGSDASNITFSSPRASAIRSEEHTSELQSRQYLHSFPTRRSSDLYKQIDLGSIVPDVPGENCGVGRFKHHLLEPQGIRDPRRNIRSPGPDAFRNPFGFSHDEVGAGVEKALRLFDAPLWVPRAFRF